MDSLFYLMHGFNVLAVEANPFSVIDVRAAMRRYAEHHGTGQLRVLNAAIVSDEERAEMAGTSPAVGKLSSRLQMAVGESQVGRTGGHTELGVEVPFHIH